MTDSRLRMPVLTEKGTERRLTMTTTTLVREQDEPPRIEWERISLSAEVAPQVQDYYRDMARELQFRYDTLPLRDDRVSLDLFPEHLILEAAYLYVLAEEIEARAKSIRRRAMR